MKTSHLFSTLLITPAAVLLLGAGSGCVTPMEAREEQATQQREDMMILQDKLNKVTGKMEGLELEVQRLDRELETLRRSQSNVTQGQVQALERSLSDLDHRLGALDSARAKDRQEIIDSLSGKIAKLMSSATANTGAGTRKGSGKTTPPKTGGKTTEGQTGYEHTVKQGESLSAIATVYGVTSKAIMDANNMTNAHKLHVGQKLFIPQ